MNKFLIGGAAAAAILVGGVAVAATTGTAEAARTAQPARSMRHGRTPQPVTRAAVQARVAAVFAHLDTNHDGFITSDEVNAVEAQREQKVEQRAARFDPSKAFDHLDANHDGKITVAEVNAARTQRAQASGGQPAKAQAVGFSGLFAKADANKDNVLTRAEFDAMGQQLKARMEHASVARGGMATRMFNTADANKDGRVTLAEMQQAALAQFDRVDINRDGTITPQERQQARQLFKSQRQSNPVPAKH